jgi:hypothetical protein
MSEGRIAGSDSRDSKVGRVILSRLTEEMA